MALAPIAIFVFRRPDHTRRLLESLLVNREASGSRVFVFADGPRSPTDAPLVERTIATVRSSSVPNLELVTRERNVGLAASIIDGVTRLCTEFGRAIVLEDDLVVSPSFLAYMNAALDLYEDHDRVHQVAGFMYPTRIPTSDDAVFLPFISSWGWATWRRAWRHFDVRASSYERLIGDAQLRRRFDLGGRYYFSEMLRRQVRGEVDSWAIRWYLTVFMREGLALFPRMSLVQNEGFGGDGTHCSSPLPAHAAAVANAFRVARFPEVHVSPGVLSQVSEFMGRDYRLRSRALNAVRRAFLGARR